MFLIKKLLNKITAQLSHLDIHTLEVITKSSSSVVVKIIGMSISLVVSISLGRLIGADGIGIIGLANRIVSVLMVLALLGFPQVIIKQVAIAKNNNNLHHISNVIYSVNIISGLFSFLLSIVLILLSPWFANDIFNEPNLTTPLIVAAMVFPAQAFSRIFGAGLIGYKKIWQSNLVDQTLSVAVTGGMLLIAWILKVNISVNLVAVFYAIGRITVTITVGAYWKSIFKYKRTREFIPKELFKTSIPLMFISLLLLLSSSVDTIMLGWLSDSTQLGYYIIALQLAYLTSFFLQVANSVLMPKIAALFSEKKLIDMQVMIQKTTKYLSIIGLLFVISFIIMGKTLLALWGDEFIQAYYILVILSCGQFFNMASGPVASILMMCNYEKTLQNILFCSVFINIFLNYFTIKYYGGNGAALSTAITVAFVMIVSSYFVKIKLGYMPFKF